MSKIEKAAACFEEGFNCAQAVFTPYGEAYGLDPETALKLAGGFGAGMGCMAETCGTVSGSVMAIGLKYGRSKISDLAAKERTNELVQEFTEKFKARHGSIVCKALLGLDLSTEKGRKDAKERNTHATCCSKLVKDAVEILEEIL